MNVEAIRAARAMISVLDQNIKDLKAKQYTELPSERQLYVYNFPLFEGTLNGTTRQLVSEALVFGQDAAFCADSVLVSVATDRAVSLQLTDVSTGRDFIWGKANNKNNTDKMPLQLLPNSSKSQAVQYVWFDLPAEALFPRAAQMRATVEFAAGIAQTEFFMSLAFSGYKVFAE